MRQGSPSRRRRRPATATAHIPSHGSQTGPELRPMSPGAHARLTSQPVPNTDVMVPSLEEGTRTHSRPLPVPVPRSEAASPLGFTRPFVPMVPEGPHLATLAPTPSPPPRPRLPTPPPLTGTAIADRDSDEPKIPPLARSPSPRSPHETRPPIPVIMIDGEVMTDDMMDPVAADPDANIATSDEAPAPQHASSSSAAERELWQGSRVSEGITAACYRCSRWIGGAMVHAMGHEWHARCFTCAHCGMPLEHVSFYEHDGQPYCHLDFHELFSRRCYHCKTPIVEERFVTVDAFGESRAYHELHFFCASCGEPFIDPKDADDTSLSEGSRPFFVHGRHAYCESCHHRLHRPKCHACHRPVGDEHVEALRAVWHRECFVCTRCRKPCLGAVFAAPDGSPCDFDCYQAWIRGGTSGPAPPAPPSFVH